MGNITNSILAKGVIDLFKKYYWEDLKNYISNYSQNIEHHFEYNTSNIIKNQLYFKTVNFNPNHKQTVKVAGIKIELNDIIVSIVLGLLFAIFFLGIGLLVIPGLLIIISIINLTLTVHPIPSGKFLFFFYNGELHKIKASKACVTKMKITY